MANSKHLEVAIIGGGIAGIGLAIGLLARGIKPTIYERTPAIREIGASVGFSTNSEWAMDVLDPRLLQHFKNIMTQSTSASMTWIDGQTDETVLVRSLSDREFGTCHRVELLDGMTKLLPPDIFRFNKKLQMISDLPQNRKVHLTFSDNSTATADIVIGCDGVKSQVKKLIFNNTCPASYSGKYAFRALLPLDKVISAIGYEKATNRLIHLGQDTHMFSCNVSNKFFNIVAYRTDPNPWPETDKVTAMTTKADALEGFGTFPTVKKVIELLPDELERWGIFDTFEYPPTTYAKGRVCIVGDAAHAMGPYMGTGAGAALEDAACLAHLIDKMVAVKGYGEGDAPVMVQAALQSYSETRMPRTRWSVKNARFAGEMMEFQIPEIGRDYAKMIEEANWRLNTIWSYDIDAMLAEAEQQFSFKLRSLLPSPRL